MVCSLRSGARVVIEIMDRDKARLGKGDVMAELAEALQNRGAHAAIAIMSSADNTTMLGRHFAGLSACSWAVVLDKDLPNLIALQVAYSLARVAAYSAAAPTPVGIDLDQVAQEAEAINTALTQLAEVQTLFISIGRCKDKGLTDQVCRERDRGSLGRAEQPYQTRPRQLERVASRALAGSIPAKALCACQSKSGSSVRVSGLTRPHKETGFPGITPATVIPTHQALTSAYPQRHRCRAGPRVWASGRTTRNVLTGENNFNPPLKYVGSRLAGRRWIPA